MEEDVPSSQEMTVPLRDHMGRRVWQPRERRIDKIRDSEVRYDFEEYEGPESRIGWVLNMLPTTIRVGDNIAYEVSALELYLLSQDNGQFRVAIAYEPYFYVATALVHEARTAELCGTLNRRFHQLEGMRTEIVLLEDLDTPNHVAGRKRNYIKLNFRTVNELMQAKKELASIIKTNKPRLEAAANRPVSANERPDDLMNCLEEIREYDVPYYMRAAIDLDIRVGAWVEVGLASSSKEKKTKQPDINNNNEEEQDDTQGKVAQASLSSRFTAVWRRDILVKPTPRVMAFDIECTKAALKFPNAEHDEVFMISYMIDGEGFLIISRTVVSKDIADLEYTPKPKFPGKFKVFNEIDEIALLKRFIQHCRQLKPHVYVTYNGDFFDWPFIKRRCQIHGLDIEHSLGIACDDRNDGKEKISTGGEFRGFAGPVHLDAFYWVKRDSYLPQGSQGLKAVTKCKLGYEPIEVDAEDMVRFAGEEPQTMAEYSVSDAVSTYYLYVVYVNLFIFSLCTVIPNGSEDVLRKGSGTLCESLLMVQAYKANVVTPNKQNEPYIRRHEGRVLESETYVGGHVECLDTGVFRSDLEYSFDMDPIALINLAEKVERDVRFAIEVEAGAKVSECVNFTEVCCAIREKLDALRAEPTRMERPFIYHLDVGAMYPNIILTNRLQPTAIVSRADCAACDYNDGSREGGCKRPMEWIWRGEVNPASAADVNQLRRQLQYEIVDGQSYHELPEKERADRLKARLKDYSQKVYKKTRVVKQEPRVDVVCMRENSFYVDTVRAFRDRRYEYKALVKKWKKQKVAAEGRGDETERKQAEDKEELFDSLQLAHKCILNSFYGYVMRKGARWRSMPMAGIVTLTGANLITQARELVEKLGRPLELDTDGIWCMLPASFPENYELQLRRDDGTTKKVGLSYPCAMLNADVHENYTNHQYQTLVKSRDESTQRDTSYYATSSECSIFFEVDGPYRCMVLPASTEEGRLLKKRYAVFNHDGSLAELKGFELKRRGELSLIKTFQSEIFEQFLQGDSLEACYTSVANIANQWLDVLDTHGAGLDDEDLLDLISENRAMSREVEQYEGRKMTSLTTARRLADFLGDDMLADKGLQCKLVIASRPRGAPVTDRAIPTAIFAAEPAVKRHYLRKWLRDPNLDGDVREVLDWGYYRERLDGVIRKIITIPAALQRVANPVPRVAHPDWLKRIVAQRDDTKKQTKISDHFQKSKRMKKVLVSDTTANKRRISTDLEDICSPHKGLSTTARVTQPEVVKPQGPPPQIHEDFSLWLEDRKRRWRARRKETCHNASSLAKKNKKTEESKFTDPTVGKKRTLGITDMVRLTTDALHKGVWRVLELRPSETAGEMHCWVLTELGHLQRVVVTVSRLLYLEIRGDDAEAAAAVRAVGGRRAPHWKAPKPSLHKGNVLYELHLPERRYAENSRALATFLAHPGLDAAYELATPLWFRSLLVLGQFARVHSSGAALNQHADFDLDELSLVCDHEASADMVRHVFLYHARCVRTGRAIVALFFLNRNNNALEDDGNNQKQQKKKCGHRPVAVIALADPKAKRGEKPPPVKRLYDMVARPEETQKKSGRLKRMWGSASDDEEEEESEEEEDEYQYENNNDERWSALTVHRSELVKDESSAFALASSALAEYAGERRGASLVIVQSSTPAKLLRRSVPVLGDFPNVEMTFHEADSEFPALGWRSAMAKRSFERLTACPAWLEARFATARFGNVPVGNLGDDPLIRVADTAFARLLRNNRHLLWASESPQPDLGSGGDEAIGGVLSGSCDKTTFPENLLEHEYARAAPTLGSIGRHSRDDPLATRQADDALDSPGAYRCACVRLDVFGAAVNAVMVADALDEEDDYAGAPNSTDYGDTLGGCRDAFDLLKSLVNDWLNDVKNHNSSHADALLVAFYRWLSARSSLLHFPDLRNFVLGLMRRVHSKLVAELRRLGMRVIHADFHELVLATDKHDPFQALDHLRFVASTLSARPIFTYLSLEPTAWYASLLWIDPHNFAAIEPLDQPKDEESNNVNQQNISQQRRVMAMDDDDDEDKAEDAPAVAEEEEESPSPGTKSEDKFVSKWKLGGDLPELAREYLDVLVGSFMHKPLQCARERASLRAAQHDSSHIAVAAAAKQDDDDDQQAIIDTAISVVQEYIADKLMELISELQRRDDYYTDASAPLNFVKLVTHLLSLDPNVQEDVRKIRRLGLAKVGVPEFAPEATFSLPATAVMVKDVTCSFCNACADLDLSDPNCRVSLSSTDKKRPSIAICCTKCSSHYDLLDLELRVAEQLHHLSSAYVSSDLRCNKCYRVATSNMATLCACSGVYVVDVPHHKLKEYIGACASIAEDLNMPYLAELTQRLQA